MTAHLVTVVIVAAVLPILGLSGKTIPEEQFSVTLDLPLVEISDGKIVGTNNVTVDKKVPYTAFRGIPYAQPPIGDLRFASPVKNSRWSGYWDATEDASVCVQGSGDDVRGSEDCLYINVYTPQNARNLAVMVWLHGGAFTSGDSTYRSYGPDYLLEDGVVFVSFNYRLGIFGFMCTEDQTVSGNFALKDQVLALQWVKDNIRQFGGDPDRVTIFGESAGGAAVSYLLQIPKAQGLFNAAIVQSGNSENLWALATRARQAAFQVAYNMGIITLLARTLLTRLRAVDAYRLQATSSSVVTQILVLNPLRGLVWAPVIEVEGPNAVFTQKSDEFFRSGQFPNKVPTMIGYTSNEAGHAHSLPDSMRAFLLFFDVAASNLAPWSLTSTSSIRSQAANEIRSHFFGVDSISSQIHQVVKYINADQFTRGTRRMAENVSPFIPVYFYIFGYMGKITGENDWDGVGHAEELAYLFRTYTDQYSPEDLIVRSKLVRLWTNFAKSFNPTPTREALLDNVTWPTVNSASRNMDYVWLNFTITRDTNPDEADYRFYQDNIFNRYGDPPYSTY